MGAVQDQCFWNIISFSLFVFTFNFKLRAVFVSWFFFFLIKQRTLFGCLRFMCRSSRSDNKNKNNIFIIYQPKVCIQIFYGSFFCGCNSNRNEQQLKKKPVKFSLKISFEFEGEIIAAPPRVKCLNQNVCWFICKYVQHSRG